VLAPELYPVNSTLIKNLREVCKLLRDRPVDLKGWTTLPLRRIDEFQYWAVDGH
jgi:hypothetical protein